MNTGQRPSDWINAVSDDVRRLNPHLFGEEDKRLPAQTQSGPLVRAIPTRQSGIRFRSKTEARAWVEVTTWAGFVPAMMHYEPYTLNLSGGRYTVDIELVHPDTKRLWWVEVKGNKRAYASWRGSGRAIREAATAFAYLADVYLLVPSGREWTLTQIAPDPKA